MQKGNNVREKGLEIKKGNLALSANTLLTPAAIGYLASIGIAEVLVFSAPKACIIITGNELQKPGKPMIQLRPSATIRGPEVQCHG